MERNCVVCGRSIAFGQPQCCTWPEVAATALRGCIANSNKDRVGFSSGDSDATEILERPIREGPPRSPSPPSGDPLSLVNVSPPWSSTGSDTVGEGADSPVSRSVMSSTTDSESSRSSGSYEPPRKRRRGSRRFEESRQLDIVDEAAPASPSDPPVSPLSETCGGYTADSEASE